MGYVGLPLITAFTEVGFPSLSFDLNAATIEKLQRGESHILDIDAARVQTIRQSGQFDATTDFSRLSECDVAIICVPTPLTDARDPDLSAVRSEVTAIFQHFAPRPTDYSRKHDLSRHFR